MKYRKKPVVIEAIQWDGTLAGVRAIREWAPELMVNSLVTDMDGIVAQWRIGTLEGGHNVSKYDFVIRGVANEFYSCKPDIFRATYDAVPD